MSYEELEKKLNEFVEKILRTKANTAGWVNFDAMYEDFSKIITDAFDE